MHIIWTQLPLKTSDPNHQTSLVRSSNNLVVVNDKAYVFGGEGRPREPVDDELWEIDLKGESSRLRLMRFSTESDRTERYLFLLLGLSVSSRTITPTLKIVDGSTHPITSQLKPSARVGSALTITTTTTTSSSSTSTSIYLYGGRESKEMSPCDSDLWIIDIAAKEGWRRLKTTQDGSEGKVEGEGGSEGCGVERKSYHALAVLDGEVYRQSFSLSSSCSVPRMVSIPGY